MSEQLRPTVSIELITPLSAKLFLMHNTANRSLRSLAVSEYTSEMKSGAWMLGCDAIGFDTDGVLINGQHRLNAVIKSGVACEFIVARNLPTKTKDALDIGKRRMLHERLTIAGNKLTAKETNICTLLLTPWPAKCLVRIKSSAMRQLVVDIHKLYKPSIDLALSTCPTGNGCELAAAVYLGEHSPPEDVKDFISLITSGVRADGTTQPGDSAVRLYRDYRINLRARGKRGNDMQNFRMCVTAAEKFASKSSVRALKAYLQNPFYEMQQQIALLSSGEVAE